VGQTATAGPSTPAFELDARVRELQHGLQARGVDGVLILQNADLFYYAGTVQQSHLYVPAGGEPTLFVRRVLYEVTVAAGRAWSSCWSPSSCSRDWVPSASRTRGACVRTGLSG